MTPAVAATPVGAAASLAGDARALFARGVEVAAGAVLASLDGLTPGEAALVARAVPKRRHEFAAGRRLARELLARFGRRDFDLLADDARAPLWPDGVIGSISHSAGACVVAVAERGAFASLGIDVEQASAVRPELWPTVLDAREAESVRGARGHDPLALAAVLFSAKEAIYKAQFPLTRARLGFHDVRVELDLAGRGFRARVPGFARPLAGAFAIRPPWVLTGLALDSGAAA